MVDEINERAFKPEKIESRFKEEGQIHQQTGESLDRLALATEVEDKPKRAARFDQIPDADSIDIEIATRAIETAYQTIEGTIQSNLQSEIDRINERIKTAGSQEQKDVLIAERWDRQSGLETVRALLDNRFSVQQLLALVAKESRFDADATSPTGARGLFQITTIAAKGVEKYFGVQATNLADPVESATAGILYLARCRFYMVDKIDSKLEDDDKDLLAYAMYNAGFGTVKGLWENLEPINYIDFELRLSGVLCKQLGRDDCSSTLVHDDIYGVPYREYGGITACLDPGNANHMNETLKIKGKELPGLTVRKAGEVLRYGRMISALRRLELPERIYGPLISEETAAKPLPIPEVQTETEKFKIPAGWGYFTLEKEFGVSRFYLGRLNGFSVVDTELKAGQEILVPSKEIYERAKPYLYQNGGKPWVTVQKGKGFWSILVTNESYNKYLEEEVQISKEEIREVVVGFNQRFNPELANLKDDASNIIENAQIWIPNVDFFIQLYEGKFRGGASEPIPAPTPAPEPPPETLTGSEVLDKKTAGQYVRWDGKKWVRDRAEMAKGAEKFPAKKWEDHPKWVEMPKERDIFSGRVHFEEARYVILHSTIGSSEKTIRDRDAHFVIERDGTIKYLVYIRGVEKKHQMAPHAGQSVWNGLNDLNRYAIGIEVVAENGQEWSKSQKKSAKEMVEWLGGMYGLHKRDILRHRQIASHKWGRGRKSDPVGETLFEELGLPDNDRLLDLDSASKGIGENSDAIKKRGDTIWAGAKAAKAIR